MLRIVTISFVGGLLILAGVGVQRIVEQDRLIRGALPTPAVVTRSEVVTTEQWDVKNRRIRRNSPRIEYRYTVDGREYASDAIDPAGGRFGIGMNAAETVAAYPAGRAVTAYVDPSDTASAHLERRYSFVPYLQVLLPLILLPLAAAIAATAMHGPVRTCRAEPEFEGWFRLALRDRTVPAWVWPTTGLLGLLVGGAANAHYWVRVAGHGTIPATVFSIVAFALFILPIWRWLTGRDGSGLEAVWVNHHPASLQRPLTVRADVPDVEEGDELRIGLLCRRIERRPMHKGERYVRPVIAETWVDAQRTTSTPGHFEATLMPPPSGVPSSEANGKLPRIAWELVAKRNRPDGSPAQTVAPIRVVD